MHRLTAFVAFIFCFMLTLVCLPRLAEALWGGKSLFLALVYMTFPVFLWAAYFFGARPEIMREERLKKLQQFVGSADSESPVLPKRGWLHALAPYSVWLMSFSAVGSGWDGFTGLAAPLGFRLIFLVCVISCGVLGFFLGWEDVQKLRKEQRALRDVEPEQVAAKVTQNTITATVDTPESEAVLIRRG